VRNDQAAFYNNMSRKKRPGICPAFFRSCN
jgi:hypothetical protein